MSWIGLSWETIITVNHGKVTQRAFKYINNEGFDIPQEDLEWTETEEQLGTNKNTSAAAVQTLDDIYNKAKYEWLIPRKKTTTYFEAKDDGLISKYGYVDNTCMDDCFTGIRITYIEAL